MAPKKRIVQTHHLQYESRKPDKVKKDGTVKKGGLQQRELTVRMYAGEHYIITQIQRLKPENCSVGFVTALKTMLPILEQECAEVE